MSGSSRWWPRAVLVGAALLVAGTVVMLARDREPGPDRDDPQARDLGEVLGTFTAGQSASAPYRPPTTGEREAFLAGLRLLADKDTRQAEERLRPLGYSVRTGTDPRTGRDYGLAVNEPGGDRAWGLYLLDLSRPTTMAIEVPHPVNDLHTEELGLELYRRVAGGLLAVSGTHRRAGDGAGDVAHQTDSMFHAVAKDLAKRGLPQVQLHGFHDASLPDADIVVSPGAGEVGARARRAAERLDDEGFTVCRSWQRDCGRLEGTRNKQGIDAADRRTVFLHIEISRTVRDDPDQRAKLADALAAADLTDQ